MSASYIIFSHGKDSEPWGSKITAMAEVARQQGLSVESVDYRGMEDPAVRVRRLVEVCRKLAGPVLLAGASLGGHVSAAASTRVPTRGLFLLAPAFFMRGFEQHTPVPAPCPVTIVHGWNDDVVPVENSIRYAQQYKSTLHVLDSDHRLNANLDEICELLDRFLRRALAHRPAPRD